MNDIRNTYLLGVSGKIGSGKSTVGRYLESTGVWRVIRFADTLKGMTAHVLSELGYDEDDVNQMIDGDLKEVMVPELGLTPRSIFQSIGTEFRMGFNPRIWFDITMGRQHDIRRNSGFNVAIDDVRFYDPEVIGLRKENAILWKVNRPGLRPLNNSVEDFERIEGHGPLLSFDKIQELFLSAYDTVFTDHVKSSGVEKSLNGKTLEEVRDIYIKFLNEVVKSIPKSSRIQAETKMHISEQMPDDKYFDTVFQNEGSVADLQQKIGNALVSIDIEGRRRKVA